jgi:hypothetical protein
MALPRPRLDPYGAPLTPLAEARQEVLYERPLNQEQRRVLLQLLQEQLQSCLRRGVYAHVAISFDVQDGILQKKVSVAVRHDHYTTAEGG